MEDHVTAPSNTRSEAVVVDIQMPFMSMVTFMVKWVIASIPAFMILVILGSVVVGLVGGIVGGLMHK
jgi:hypothetical protein